MTDTFNAATYLTEDRVAAGDGDRVAFHHPRGALTYRRLTEEVRRVAAGLVAIGVRPEERVLLAMVDDVELATGILAVMYVGAVAVPSSTMLTGPELGKLVVDSRARVLLGSSEFTAAVTTAATGAPDLRHLVVTGDTAPGVPGVTTLTWDELRTAEPLDTPYPTWAESPALWLYTSGTTGTPKGAMLTHANLYINAIQINAWAQTLIDGEERVLGALPLFHVFAMTVVMNMGIAKAANIILMPRFVLDEALGLINSHKPTMMPAVPTIFTAMMNSPKIKSYDMSSLKFCISGGAPLPLEVKMNFEKLTGASVVEGYGLSEASPVVTCNPVAGPVVAGSIGVPLPQTIISLRDLEDPAKEVPPGERGELCVKAPQVMKGYWKKPSETAAQFVGDFLRTGDVAIMDENGFFAIVDRIKDLIICSGFNVYPRRIEEAIYEHPAVEEVTVIGIPDAYRGEAPKAFIKLKSGASATSADIFKHLEPKISKMEMPSQIEFRDSLPKTMIGKLSKKELVAEEKKKKVAGA